MANEFVVKSDAQIEALSNDEKTAYFRDYQKHLHSLVEQAEKNATMTAEQVKEMTEKINGLDMKQFNAMIEAVKENGQAIRNFMEKGDDNRELTLKSILETHKEDLLAVKKGVPFEFHTKAVGNMGLAINVTGDIPQALREPGFNTVASRKLRLFDLMSIRSISSNKIEWTYQSGKEGTAGHTAENALKNQIDFDLLVGSESAEKYTAFITLSTEMLDDIDFIEEEINKELMKEVRKAIEAHLYNGTGTSQLRGLYTIATAFSPTATFALGVDNANVVDLMVAMYDQVENADQEMPDYFLLNPSVVNKLVTDKLSATDKRYIERLTYVAGNLAIDGIPIVKSTLVGADEIMCGRIDLATLFQVGDIKIEMGRSGDDFKYNRVTVICEWRGMLRVKHNDRTAFVKSGIAAGLTAIETT